MIFLLLFVLSILIRDVKNINTPLEDETDMNVSITNYEVSQLL